MESSTILHLDLLKKLSSHHPQSKNSFRFTTFRTKTKQYLHKPQPFQPLTEEKHSFISKTSLSNRAGKFSQRKYSLLEEKTNDNVCGWSISNEQTLDQIQKSKSKNFAPLRPQIINNLGSNITFAKRTLSKYKRINLSKTIICIQHAKSNFLSKNISKFNQILINPSSIHTDSSANTVQIHFSRSNKENVIERELLPRQSHRPKNPIKIANPSTNFLTTPFKNIS